LALDGDFRRRLLAFVMEHPGCTLHRASKGIGLPRARLLRHLTPLKETGVVAEVGAKPRTLLVVNCAGIQQHSDQLRALADPDVRTVYQWLRYLGPTQPQQVIRMAAARRGWPRATIQRWLSQLVKVGLAEHRREGRLWTQIESRPPAPPVSTALRLAESTGSPDRNGGDLLGTLADGEK
jgi:DNA-binding IclR family transcriptional regulator